ALEQRGGLHAGPQFLLRFPGLDRPDVDERPAVVFRKCGRGLRLLEALTHVGRLEHLHSEEWIAARCIDRRRAARVDERRIDGNARREWTAQREAAPCLRRPCDEYALLRTNGPHHPIRHTQPPETAGTIVTTSPGFKAVWRPARSRTLSAFTKMFRCRRTAPVSSHTLPYNAGRVLSRSS